MAEEMTSGEAKVSSGPSESAASSGPSGSSVPSGVTPGSGSSNPSSSSGEDCVCDVAAAHWDTTIGGGGSTTTFRVGANGTCDVTITEFSTSYTGGDHAFTGGEPFFLPAGAEEPFTYARPGDPSGDEIFVHYICENGHSNVIGFTIP
jgi:hypothetical protein